MSSKLRNGSESVSPDQEEGLTRRKVLYTCGCVGAAALMSAEGSLRAFAAGGAMPRPKQMFLPKKGDLLVFAEDNRKGEVVSLKSLAVDGPPVLVLPKDPETGTIQEEDNSKILLFRTAPEKISPELKEDSVDGVIAYSALCTHLGCVLTGWDNEKKLIACPCHGAQFDPIDNGKAVAGGPTPRALPVLPLQLDGQKLVAADGFSGWVGTKRNG